MGWWPFASSSSSNTEKPPVQDNQQLAASEQVLLEDLPKRFNPDEYDPRKQQQQKQQQQNQQKAMMKMALDSISSNDFKFETLVKIPCFRDAGLIGISSMGVLATIIFLVHKNPSRAANWGVGGGLLGSLVGWEQCRSQRKRSFENVEKAKAALREKPRQMKNQEEGKD